MNWLDWSQKEQTIYGVLCILLLANWHVFTQDKFGFIAILTSAGLAFFSKVIYPMVGAKLHDVGAYASWFFAFLSVWAIF